MLLVFSCAISMAQVRMIKPLKTHPKRTTLGFGFGAAKSVLFLARNVKENNDALGFTASLVYGGSKLLRSSLEYTFYRPIDIQPTWYDIKASTIEYNMHFIARFKESKAYFYPLFGFSYNVFSGYFTGKNDFLNLASMYQKNQYVSTKWLGFNAGVGYEQFFKRFSFFIDFKMRVGLAQGNRQLNINDVCYGAGLRFNLRVPSIYQLFRGTRSRYLLDTEK
jgi:hypothetical protein